MRSISLVSLVLLCAACGGNKDALEKKVSGLQEEVTRLQNGNDRLAERLQAVELGIMKSEPSMSEKRTAEEKDRVVRPPLKVVHVGPGNENIAEEAAAEPTPEPEQEKRPVLKDYGSGRATKGGMGQTAPRRPAVQNPPGTLK
jgi:hypothetical protein